MRSFDPAARDRWSCRLALGMFLVLLIIGLPLFVCMPLYQDASFFDVAASNLLRGGVHYRDIIDHNLPGIVWLQLGIRSAFGWRSETLRAVDFLIVMLTVGLLFQWLRRTSLALTGCMWTALVLLA